MPLLPRRACIRTWPVPWTQYCDHYDLIKVGRQLTLLRACAIAHAHYNVAGHRIGLPRCHGSATTAGRDHAHRCSASSMLLPPGCFATGHMPQHTRAHGSTHSWVRPYGGSGNTVRPLLLTAAVPPQLPAIGASQIFEMHAARHGAVAAARTPPHGCPWTARHTLQLVAHRPGGCARRGRAAGWLTWPWRVLHRTVARGRGPPQNGSMGTGPGLKTAPVSTSEQPHHLQCDRYRQFELGGLQIRGGSHPIQNGTGCLIWNSPRQIQIGGSCQIRCGRVC